MRGTSWWTWIKSCLSATVNCSVVIFSLNLEQFNAHAFFAGTRACFGKFVAEINLFTFFVSLLQNFTCGLSSEHDPPCMKNRIGLSHEPSPFHVKVSERKPKLVAEIGWSGKQVRMKRENNFGSDTTMNDINLCGCIRSRPGLWSLLKPLLSNLLSMYNNLFEKRLDECDTRK